MADMGPQQCSRGWGLWPLSQRGAPWLLQREDTSLGHLHGEHPRSTASWPGEVMLGCGGSSCVSQWLGKQHWVIVKLLLKKSPTELKAGGRFWW